LSIFLEEEPLEKLVFPLDPVLLSRYVEDLGRHGALPEGGCFRPVYSRQWDEAKNRVRQWMDEIGLEVREDAVGNLFGRLSGREPGVILTGSHLDTVKRGGKYDGALGIIAGLMAVRALKETFPKPRKSIEVVATCQEESSRFSGNFWGTRAILGKIGEAEPDRIKDPEGISIGQAMRERGYDPTAIPAARREDIGAFVELHVEQGKILESEGIAIGVVHAITGITHSKFEVIGQSNHAGTTPMDLRRDALTAFAEMALGIDRIAREAGRPAVATIGTVHVFPGAIAIIPERVEFTLDLRHPEASIKEKLNQEIQDLCRRIAEREKLEIRMDPILEIPGIPMNPEIVKILEQAARRQGASYKLMVSAAGHDAQIFAQRCPTAMIFVPSREGRSHCPEEYTSEEDALKGIEILAAALYQLAY